MTSPCLSACVSLLSAFLRLAPSHHADGTREAFDDGPPGDLGTLFTRNVARDCVLFIYSFVPNSTMPPSKKQRFSLTNVAWLLNTSKDAVSNGRSVFEFSGGWRRPSRRCRFRPLLLLLILILLLLLRWRRPLLLLLFLHSCSRLKFHHYPFSPVKGHPFFRSNHHTCVSDHHIFFTLVNQSFNHNHPLLLIFDKFLWWRKRERLRCQRLLRR